MSAAALGAAVLFLSAALLGSGAAGRLPGGRRTLVALGTLLLLPALPARDAWPLVAVAAGAAVFTTPLPCLAAALAALAVAGGPLGDDPRAAPFVLMAVALAAALAAIDEVTMDARRRGLDPAWLAVAAGLLLSFAALVPGGGRVLAWRFAIDGAAEPVAIPGAGLLLGLAFLGALGGSLLLLAHLVTPRVPSAPVRGVALRGLALAATLAVLFSGFAFWRAADLVARNASWQATAFGALLLAVAVADALRPRDAEGSAPLLASALPAGFALAVGGTLAVGAESVYRLGTYATPAMLAGTCAVLCGLAALQRTRLGLVRRAAFAIALALAIFGR